MVEALVVDLIDNQSQFDPDQMMPDPQDILAIFSSLITTSSPITTMDVELQVNTCGSGIECDDQSTIIPGHRQIKLAHLSVKKYLTGEQIQNGPVSKYSFDQKQGDTLIAQTCLAYISQFDTVNSVGPPTPSNFPLSQYAAKFWITHVQCQFQDNNIPYAIQNLITNLLQPQGHQFISWVQFFNIDHNFDFWRSPQILSMESIPVPLYYTSLRVLEKTSQQITCRKRANASHGRNESSV